jgi:pimeloyl-ACP methyl ester carboxylesterase
MSDSLRDRAVRLRDGARSRGCAIDERGTPEQQVARPRGRLVPTADPWKAVNGMEDARRRTVLSGDVELSVVEYGDPASPPLVLVHGYPDNKEVWTPVAERLAERFHVVLYDVRGHGESTAPQPLRGGFRLECLTRDFLAVVDAVSPNRPVHLVGHDWGSVQGWEFATVRETEGRIASFTSISGPCLDHFGHWIRDRLRHPTVRRTAQLLCQKAKSWYVYALRTPVFPELAWHGPLGRRWPMLLARSEGLSDDCYPTESLPQDAAHGAWLYRDNVRRRFRRPRPDAHSHVPVQLIIPTGDPFLSPALYDDLERWVPELSRRSVPAKHWLPRSMPKRLAEWISEFVLRHEPGRAPATGSGRGTGADARADDGPAPALGSPATNPLDRLEPDVIGQRAESAPREADDDVGRCPPAQRQRPATGNAGRPSPRTRVDVVIGRITAILLALARPRVFAPIAPVSTTTRRLPEPYPNTRPTAARIRPPS